MTRAARIKGVLVGLAMVASGTLTILWARGAFTGPPASADLCATPSTCENGCAKGHAVDCRQAGLFYLQGAGVERSPERALGFLRTACDAGDPSGCTALGALLAESGGAAAAGSAEVRAIFAKACDAGDAMGCNNLANMYDEGADRDPARARALYERACDRGSGMACSAMGKAFQSGDGVLRDATQANRFFSRSVTLLQSECDLANARACGQVGWLAERGLGVEKDVAKALRDYQAGCDGSDGASCYNLALTRPRTGADDPVASALFAKACKLGFAEACGSKPPM